mmetsp:Transcript_45245/g.113413  ORF Transcript_45245/g.113413 Transcript_45245/m.113413 type:complete len:224 (+) Transcript_45245:431-1102(+)
MGPLDLPLDREVKALPVRVPRKGGDARQQDVESHPEAPDVDGRAVRLLLDNLRGNVPWGAAQRVQELGVGAVRGEPEVPDADPVGKRGADRPRLVRRLVREQKVFGLEVAVDDPLAVQVRQGPHHLAHDLGGVALGEVAVGGVDDAVEELAPREVLEDDVVLVLILHKLLHVNNVMVRPYNGANADLFLQILLLLLLDSALLHLLQSPHLPRVPVNPLPHCRV